MLPGDTLGPHQIVRAVLELLGEQRGTPEEPEQQRDDQCQVDDVHDGAVPPEQLLTRQVGAARGAGAVGQGEAVVVRHDRAGNQEEDGEDRQGGTGEEDLVAMETPNEEVHCT